MRPQATVFADSARNRESVQNLGTIAHLQYYFARTGLLDGKGAQLAKATKVRGPSDPEISTSEELDPSYTPSYGRLSKRALKYTAEELFEEDDSHRGDYTDLVGSPISDTSSDEEVDEPMMLPPTVSTYKSTPVYVPPPPDTTVLRRELREYLDDTLKVLKELDKGPVTGLDNRSSTAIAAVERQPGAQGWYEIQGLHVLDIVTLAIRAARVYYTAHEQPQRLYAIKPERTIRAELYKVLEILKRIATRNFAGGIRTCEKDSILEWAVDIGKLLDTEEEKEQQEQEEREKWSWVDGDWTGKERERESLFLKSFYPDAEQLPAWTEPADGIQLPTPFLKALQNGLGLVRLHNELVKKSRRQFEEIKHYHTDTAKPYRCADNLRYWVKTAELRWDVKMDIDVMGIVHGTDDTAWRKFDQALLQWCKGVREEIILEWKERKIASQIKTPTLTMSLSSN